MNRFDWLLSREQLSSPERSDPEILALRLRLLPILMVKVAGMCRDVDDLC